MQKLCLSAILSGILLFSTPGAWAVAASPCDLNGDGSVNSIDVQLASSMALGSIPCTATIAGVGVCNDAVVQRVTNAAAGGTCVVGDAHSVSLNWKASISQNIIGYNVYRGSFSGGPYTRLNANPLAVNSYTDDGVPSGQVFYYAATTIDRRNNESAFTVIAQTYIPHSVSLSWTASTSSNVLGYLVYRGTAPGGPYTKVPPGPVAATGYTDYTVQPGAVYYYVATTIDKDLNESAYSLIAQAVIPFW